MYYVYDGNTVILELDGNGAEKARNVYGRNLMARESDGEKAIYRYNGHGDVIALNAPNGDMIAEYAYDEFGQVIEEQAAPQATPMVDIDFSVEGSEEYDFPEDAIFDNPYRYAGYEYLDEVYYDPSIARFLTEDPYYNLGNRVMGVYEINVPNVYSIMQANALYAYCGNSPVVFVDLSGFEINLPYAEDESDPRFVALQALTDDTLYLDESNMVLIKETSDNWERPVGSNLIYELIESKTITQINLEEEGGNSMGYGYRDDELRVYVDYNPNSEITPLTQDEDSGKNKNMSRPNYIGLGHELVHAVRRIQGVASGREDYSRYSYVDENGETKFVRERTEEIETVGVKSYKVTFEKGFFNDTWPILITIIKYNPTYYYTENALREENGLGARVSY